MNQTAILNHEFKAAIHVNGLDCPDCAAKLEKAVAQLPGVISAEMCFVSNRLKLVYDPQLTSIDVISHSISTLGYGVGELPGSHDHKTESLFYHIWGLDCADCAQKLQKAIDIIPGVNHTNVNFPSATLEVEGSVSSDDIVAAAAALGYQAEPKERNDRIQPSENAAWLSRLVTSNTLWTGILLIAAFLAQESVFLRNYAIACYLAAMVIGGYHIARSGLSMLIRGKQLDMNALMTVAAVGAVMIGQYQEGAVVVFLFSLGNTLQGYAFDRARNSIRALMDLSPRQATIIRNGVENVVPVDDIRIGDLAVVRPGERIPADGIVARGSSTVDQSNITGESIPVYKTVGDEIFAGTMNNHGSIEIRVTKSTRDNTFSRIIRLVEDAQAKKAPSQQLVDRFARYYTPGVIGFALLVAVVPPLLFGQSFYKWIYEGLALLLVACPCALVISTPVSIVSAIANAAHKGILIKGGAILEETGGLTAIAFDKTGTLTKGQPDVTDIVSTAHLDRNQLLAIAAAVEMRSAHPVGDAIVRHARSLNILPAPAEEFLAFIGSGAQGIINGQRYCIGNDRLMAEEGIVLQPDDLAYVKNLQDQAKTVVLIGQNRTLLGIIAVADVLRPESAAVISRIRDTGIGKIVMLTGDNEMIARSIADAIGIDEVRPGLLPQDKMAVMQDLGRGYGKVGMVGDGVNDAPALARATVGIAMGAAGSDAALESADIALMGDNLAALPFLITLGRKTVGIIKQNIAFSLCFKAAVLLLVFPGWLTLWLAVAADMGTSLLVTLNGLRLLNYHIPVKGSDHP